MQFEVTILGSNGAVPAYGRYPTAQVVNYNGHQFLVDCGEGAQFRMNQFGIKRGRLDNIFISHMHGDHYYGLLPLLTSLNLNGREHPLCIYGPPPLEQIINVHLQASNTQLKFPIHFYPLSASQPKVVFDDGLITVETIPLVHRLPTTGFIFREKAHLRKIIPEKIAEYHIPHELIKDIKKGASFTTADGRVIPNSELTQAPPTPRSYAYCSDTAFEPATARLVSAVSLLYHEATFIEAHAQRATETFHSTARQAATIASQAEVGRLLLGHFSARYENLQVLLDEAKEVFPNSLLAEEGKVFTV